MPNDLPYQGTPDEHMRLLKISKEVLRELSKCAMIHSVSEPTLLHTDVNKRNVYVSEDDLTNMTAFIDWQSTSIEPAFAYASQTADFAEDPTGFLDTLKAILKESSDAYEKQFELTPDEENAK
jgi:Ser/Thr protein kinase RdoA (MazF antagonist)